MHRSGTPVPRAIRSHPCLETWRSTMGLIQCRWNRCTRGPRSNCRSRRWWTDCRQDPRSTGPRSILCCQKWQHNKEDAKQPPNSTHDRPLKKNPMRKIRLEGSKTCQCHLPFEMSFFGGETGPLESPTRGPSIQVHWRFSRSHGLPAGGDTNFRRGPTARIRSSGLRDRPRATWHSNPRRTNRYHSSTLPYMS